MSENQQPDWQQGNQNPPPPPPYPPYPPYSNQGGYDSRPPYQRPPYPPYPPQRPVYYSPDSVKAFCILSYFGFLWLIGLLVDRQDPRVRFHVNQGIILTIFEAILGFAIGIARGTLHFMFGFTFDGFALFGGMASLLIGLLKLAQFGIILTYIIIGVMHAAQGREEPLPLIGNLFTVIR